MQTTPKATGQATDDAYSGWTDTAGWGWPLFAGSMIMLGGVFNIIDGLVAVFDRNYYARVTGSNNVHLLVYNNFRAWGWLIFGLGVLMVAAGFAIFNGALWGRITGVVLASANMIIQLAYLSTYPFWSFTMILVDILVIYALVARSGPAHRV